MGDGRTVTRAVLPERPKSCSTYEDMADDGGDKLESLRRPQSSFELRGKRAARALAAAAEQPQPDTRNDYP